MGQELPTGVVLGKRRYSGQERKHHQRHRERHLVPVPQSFSSSVSTGIMAIGNPHIVLLLVFAKLLANKMAVSSTSFRMQLLILHASQTWLDKASELVLALMVLGGYSVQHKAQQSANSLQGKSGAQVVSITYFVQLGVCLPCTQG